MDANLEDMRNAAAIERVKSAKRTAEAISRAAIGDFVRFRGKVFAVSEIEIAELIKPRESHDIDDKYFYGVEIRLKARNNATGARHSFEKCSAAEFDAFAGKLGA